MNPDREDLWFVTELPDGARVDSMLAARGLDVLQDIVESESLPRELAPQRAEMLARIEAARGVLATIAATVNRAARLAEIDRLKARIAELEKLP